MLVEFERPIGVKGAAAAYIPVAQLWNKPGPFSWILYPGIVIDGGWVEIGDLFRLIEVLDE